MFDLESAIKKLSMVLQPMPALVHDVLSSWKASPKGQSHFSTILKHVKKELKQFKPTIEKVKDKDKSKPKDKAKESWRSPQGSRNGGAGRNPGSGQSYSNNTRSPRQWVEPGICRDFRDRGTCRFDDCKFEHVRAPQLARRDGKGAASVNHITQLSHLRRQLRDAEEHIAEQNGQIAVLDEATNTLTEELEHHTAYVADRYSRGEEQCTVYIQQPCV